MDRNKSSDNVNPAPEPKSPGRGREALPRLYFPLGLPVNSAAASALRLRDSKALAPPGHSGGNAAAPKTSQARELAYLISLRGGDTDPPMKPAYPGTCLCAAMVADALRYIAMAYELDINRGSLSRGRARLAADLGGDEVLLLDKAFAELYPAGPVLRGEADPEAVAKNAVPLDPAGELDNLEIETVEAILLLLLGENRAFNPLRGLFDDGALSSRAPFRAAMAGLEDFYADEPEVVRGGARLFEHLRAPMRAHPDSLEDQLRFIEQQWSHMLPAAMVRSMTLARDVMKEEARLRAHGPGPVETPRMLASEAYADYDYPEPERFSRDADWMSNVVLIAKSTHVWLDQLSKKYGRHVRHLSDIPDEELDMLARWGFNCLWLIGLWERSAASERIKKIMGNPEALASAYSLYDYDIAGDLGGEAAYQDLRERAFRRGIRLASDMVPNHTGIYSRWTVEHPDWFVNLDEPPYPWYTFMGEDLSSDPAATIQIEDGYWERRDAAVVFRHRDNDSGRARYIYHGNDGTSMPWNDTAQLDFLKPEVREAVIQNILAVARKFPVIRFDAAMTLTKFHFQRLWFPRPGDAGAVPSRAEHGMSRAEFDARMPEEFWREVVDRVAAEVPDTLLLAEAFWLMEGYFVRTLGMHRVYNSAFMNMLKQEENQKYRDTIKKVLEFSPKVLKRFVNFMNNPDEDTAVEQFGKGDKYIGVCVLLVTLPGLPMFGHGQVEGYTEKYGMEYRRAYRDEWPDADLVRRHEREVFPLMRRRDLFSGAENFALYDFIAPEGHVDENVFAYSNALDGRRGLVFYNNSFETRRGRIRAAGPVNLGGENDANLVSRTLKEALGLDDSPGVHYVFREHRTGLEYLRSGEAISRDGFEVELYGYNYLVFLDFQERRDRGGSWARLAGRIGNSGVPSIEEARRAMELEKITVPFKRALVQAARALGGGGAPGGKAGEKEDDALLDALASAIAAAKEMAGEAADQNGPASNDPDHDVPDHDAPLESFARAAHKELAAASALARETPGDIAVPFPPVAAWLLARALASASMARVSMDIAPAREEALEQKARELLDAWLLARASREAFLAILGDEGAALFAELLVWALSRHGRMLALEDSGEGPKDVSEKESEEKSVEKSVEKSGDSEKSGEANPVRAGASARRPEARPLEKRLRRLFADPAAAEYLRLNEHEGATWFNKEQFERLVCGLATLASLSAPGLDQTDGNEGSTPRALAEKLLAAAEAGGYNLDDTLEVIGQ